MAGFIKRESIKAYQAYQHSLERIKEQCKIVDLAKQAADWWETLTGTRPQITTYDGSQTSIRLDMGVLTRYLRYPSRDKELLLFCEHIDTLLETAGFDFEFSESFDSLSTDKKWSKNYTIRLTVYAYHGGTCTYKQVGVKTIEQPIYEMECK